MRGEIGTALFFETKKPNAAFLTKSPRPYRRKPNINPKIRTIFRTDGYFGKSERGLRCKNNRIQNSNPQMHAFTLPPHLRKNEKSARYFAHGRHHGLYFDVLMRIYRLFYAKLTE